jgi:hypothetical protein
MSGRWLKPTTRKGTDVGAFAYAYPNGDLTDQWKVRELTLKRGAMQHELATIEIMSATGDEQGRWDSGTPIQVEYGNSAGNRSSFYGYIWKPDSTINQQVREPTSQRSMTFMALGASNPMKAGLQRVFPNSTASNIAQFVATQFMFYSVIVPSNYTWAQMVASGESYYAFMLDVALRQGYVFFTVGTTLYFVDPMGIANLQGSQYPIFHSKDAKLPPQYSAASIISFKSDNAAMTEDAGRIKANWSIAGVDLATGNVFSASDDGSSSFGALVTGGKLGAVKAGRFVTPTLARFAALQSDGQPAILAANQSDATQMIQSRSAINRFPIRATAELAGHAPMIPMQLVDFAGLGQRNSGRWLVEELTHHVVWQNWFSTTVEVMRDSDYDTTAAGVDPSLIVPAKTTPTVLVGGQWRAQYGVLQPTGPTTTLSAAVAGAAATGPGALPPPPGPIVAGLVGPPGGDQYFGQPSYLTPAQVQALLQSTAARVPGTPTGAALALAIKFFAGDATNSIVGAESSFCINVLNATGQDYSVGLFQINYFGDLLASRTASYTAPDALAANPTEQCIAAWTLFVGSSGFGPWTDSYMTSVGGASALNAQLNALGWPA